MFDGPGRKLLLLAEEKYRRNKWNAFQRCDPLGSKLALDWFKIVRLCELNKHFNAAVCQNAQLWEALFRRDLSASKKEQDYKKAYQVFYASPSEKLAQSLGYEKFIPEPGQITPG